MDDGSALIVLFACYTQCLAAVLRLDFHHLLGVKLLGRRIHESPAEFIQSQAVHVQLPGIPILTAEFNAVLPGQQTDRLGCVCPGVPIGCRRQGNLLDPLAVHVQGHGPVGGLHTRIPKGGRIVCRIRNIHLEADRIPFFLE
ncbi:hypothetical protein D3C75_758810 [compost metagenome]